MNRINPEAFQAAIPDVRNAYRLLYAYQRRLLDTAQRIAQLLGRTILGGYPLFSDETYRDGFSLKVGRSAWDWLPMYDYEFYFNDIEREGNIKFAIAFQTDTGWYDTDDTNQGNVSRTAPDQFPDTAACQSYIYFYAGRNRWKPEGFNVWEKGNEEHSNHTDTRHENFVVIRFPLSRMLTEETIIDTLLEANNFFSQNGFNDICRPLTAVID
jgi:hypothetical protein